MMVLPIVMLVLLGGFGVAFFVITKKQQKATSVIENNTKTTSSNKSNSNKKENKTNTIPKEDVFKFMEFDKIMDNMIIQNKGTKFTMIVQCKGINYDLMSDVEQLSIEEGFITFLNTLRYPIQLYVQAQNLDLKGTIKVYKENISHVKEDFETANEEYNKVNEAFDSTKDEINKVKNKRNKILNVYEYANDIVNYVERISLNKSLLQRSFYVIFSYNSSEINAVDSFSKDEIINICYNELVTRAQSIISGLSSCSVTGRLLDSNEVADVLYTAYNRDDKGLMSVREALDSGFYRLYSTSEDIFSKKQTKLQEEIDNEARIKALEALKQSIKDGEYISPRIRQLDIEEQVSKKASEIVRRENVPTDIKEKANEKLIEDYRKEKKEILEKASEEHGELLNTLGLATEDNSDENSADEINAGIDKQKQGKENSKETSSNDIVNDKTGTEAPEKVISDEENNKKDTVVEKPIVQKIKLEDKDLNFDDRLGESFDINLSDDLTNESVNKNDSDATSSENDSII